MNEENIAVIENSNGIMESAAAAVNETVIVKTNTFLVWIKSFFTWENIFKFLGTLLVIFALWIIYRIVIRAIKKIPQEKFMAQHSVVVLKLIRYVFYIVVVMYVLGLFGIKLSAILGAAGIFGVAVGFAAQTSMSNLISGLFILTEQVIKIGDAITVGDTTGVVDSIDALSIKVHTFDNQLVRIPNSKIIDTNMINFSYHPVRRLTFATSISYDNDMTLALETLLKVPALCPTVLKDPEPAAWYDGFGDSSINMTLAVYFNRDDLRQTKNDVFIAIKKVFDEAGITIPFNQLDVHVVN